MPIAQAIGYLRYNLDMQPGSRYLRIAKWIGLGIGLLIVIAWTFSLRYGAYAPIGKTTYVTSIAGLLDVVRVRHPKGPLRKPEIWRSNRDGIGLVGPGAVTSPRSGSLYVQCPYWLLVFVVAIPTAVLFYRDRRCPTPGDCKTCGYNLTGSTTGICSECGVKIVDPQQSPSPT